MIVRILGEGQFELPEGALGRLNQADDAIVAAIDAADTDAFHAALAELNAAIQQLGTPLPPEHLGPSAFTVPGPDATLEEVQALLSEEGVVPG